MIIQKEIFLQDSRLHMDKTEYSLLHNTYSIVKTSLLYIALSKVQCRILENLQGHHQARLYIIDRLRLFLEMA